jgi:hypothetical protein
MEWHDLYRNLKRLNWGVLLVLTTISYFVMSHAFTTGIMVGGLIAFANFHLLQRTIHKGFSPELALKMRKGTLIARFYLRLAAMGTLITIFVSQQWVHPVGLTVGLSIIVVSIVILSVLLIRKTSLEETP